MPLSQVEQGDGFDPLIEGPTDLNGEALIQEQITAALTLIACHHHYEIRDILYCEFPKLAVSIRAEIGENLTPDNVLKQTAARIEHWTTKSKNQIWF